MCMRPIVSPADQQCAQVNASIHRIQAISARNIQPDMFIHQSIQNIHKYTYDMFNHVYIYIYIYLHREI